ncbi:MAG: hypothetical protein LUQ09_07985 [Methanomassiliicoccales archaeon]|nr:hypothetical protein [Methanomassiliicoccales archaeon]
MRLLVASTPDLASMNLKERLLEAAEWTARGQFQGRPFLVHDDLCMVTTDVLHLHLDHFDRQVMEGTGTDIEDVVFLSKHRAASGTPTLTVHPIGNYGKADYGGREGTLTPSSPAFLSGMLREISRTAKGLPFQVSYEVTHHGPFLDRPTSFVEIGSDETNWGNEGAAKALAEALLHFRPGKGPVVIGVGGGHYAPRFTEVTLAKEVSFGHMVPKHVLDAGDDEHALSCIQKAMKASGTDAAYLHKKSFSKPDARRYREMIESAGYRILESSDLKDAQSLP